jgi:hypothetical protein
MDGICYQERAGHCTRCWAKFGGNLTAYMVWERTIWEAIGESCIHQEQVDASVRRLRFPKGTSVHDEARNLCRL